MGREVERGAGPTATIELVSNGAESTRGIGASLGRVARPGDLILLHGDLGAGKTTLAQGIARGLGVTDYVQSPTFTLVAEHEGRTALGQPVLLYHLDLYRLAGDDELDSFGFEDYLSPVDGVSVVEWPERAAKRIPSEYLLVRLENLGVDQRRLLIEAVPTDGPYAERVTALHRDLSENG